MGILTKRGCRDSTFFSSNALPKTMCVSVCFGQRWDRRNGGSACLARRMLNQGQSFPKCQVHCMSVLALYYKYIWLFVCCDCGLGELIVCLFSCWGGTDLFSQFSEWLHWCHDSAVTFLLKQDMIGYRLVKKSKCDFMFLFPFKVCIMQVPLWNITSCSMQVLSGPSSALLDQSTPCYCKDWTPTPSTTFKYRPVSQVLWNLNSANLKKIVR